MKVAFIVDSFPSLSETFILNQITGLIDRGCEVDIYAHSRPRTPKIHPEVGQYRLLEHTRYFSPAGLPDSKALRVFSHLGSVARQLCRHPFPILRSMNVAKYGWNALCLRLPRKSIPFLDGGSYDIVHCQFGPNGVLAVRLRDLGVLKGRVITHFRGFDSSSFVREHGPKVYDELFSKGDLFLCVSERIRKRLVQLGCDEAKVMIHRSGVNIGELAPATQPRRTGIRLLTIGRLVEKKGIQYAIEAVVRSAPKYPGLEYTIVGNGPLRAKLEGLIRQLKMESQIKLPGSKSRNEIRELLLNSDIVLTPSVTGENGDEEGIPVAIMEAFACGLPVVSTRHSGIPEIVRDGESGFLVAERDVEGLTARLEELLADSRRRHAMGRRGRRYVEEHHDIDKLNDRLLALYQTLAVKERSARGAASPSLSKATGPMQV